MACRTNKPSNSCCARKSHRCSSPRPKNWAGWACSYVPPPPTTCAAWPGTWTAAGLRRDFGSKGEPVSIHEMPGDDIAIGGVGVRKFKERLAQERAAAGQPKEV